MTNRYFKFIIVSLLVLLAVMTAVLIKTYIDVNREESGKDGSAENIIAQMDNNIEEYTVFENESGLLGVSEKDDRVFIEPVWNDIYILSGDRFIVSRAFDNKNKKMGIIDRDSNILVPFIFETFKYISSDFVGGFTGDNEGFILFDKKGNVLSENLWTGYRYSEKIIYLYDGESEYRGKYTDGEMQYIYIDIKCSPGNVPMDISFADPVKINDFGVENINRISDIVCGYLEYLFRGSGDISDITTEQYYTALSSNNFFKDCRIKSVSDFKADITKEKNFSSYNIKLTVNYDYGQGNADLANINSEITFNIVGDANNRLILKSINKAEL